MPTVILGGRTMERRPLLVEDLYAVYTLPGMNDIESAGYGQRVGLELLARALVTDPPVTAEQLQKLPASEWRALMDAVRDVQRECGFTAAAKDDIPGEG